MASRGEGWRERRGRGAGRVDRRKRSMLTLRTLRTERRATPARAVAAVMAAHANQHGAETPSDPPFPSPTPDKRVRVYTAYTRSGVPRRGRCAHRVASRVGERVHATRVAEPCFARTLNANHRPTDRKTDWCTRPSLRLVSLPSRRRPYFFPSYFLSPFDSLFLSSIEDRKYFDPRIRFLFRK